jgi:type VI secretion system protein ImpH
MESKIRENFARLIEDLEKQGPEYNVFYAFYLAESISKDFHPDRVDSHFDQKGLLFRPYENYEFPSRDIRSFSYEKGLMTFVLNFLGLYGIDSPLPRCYHEQVALQQNVHGPGSVPIQNFLDMFNNRFYWLYYQAWKKYRYYLHFDETPNNKIVQRIFSFVGLIDREEQKSQQIHKAKLLQLSSVLSHRIRNKKGLLILLKEFFPELKLRIQEFIPQRVKLDGLPKLGSKHGEPSMQLSRQSFIGRSIMDCTGKICIEIGPINFDDYMEFTPGCPKSSLLQDLLNLYIHDGLEYDVKFIIRSESIDTESWRDPRARLGLSLWLGKPKQEMVEVYYTYERYTGSIN